MSRETAVWLNQNVLIGNTAERGNAWHYRADLQGAEPNHYAGPIPAADVVRRLFHWDAIAAPVSVEIPADIDTMTGLSTDGRPVRSVVVPDRLAVVRPDTADTFGIFSGSYELHQFREWLLGAVSNLLGDTLSISSAGLLKRGAIAWVEVSVPETLHTPQGVSYRPNLLATTSHDGSCATTYKRTVTMTVCDNTRAAALSERGEQIKIKHTRNSKIKLADARDALSIVTATADAFAAEVASLCEQEVTRAQWNAFLDALVPRVDADGAPLSGRSLTMADGKREALGRLYTHDARVAPWAGTAFGVVQAVNTYEHHESIVRGAERAERNALRSIMGEWDSIDRDAYALLSRVLAGATA